MKSILVLAYTTDPEGVSYANDFIATFKAAGVDAAFGSWGLFQWYSPEPGESASLIVIESGRDGKTAAQPLIDALNAAPLKYVSVVENPTKEGGEAYLAILPKPITAPASWQ